MWTVERNVERNAELREIRAAGIRALNSLRRAEKALSSARGWGIADMLGGKGIVSLVKHVKLDAARDALEEARFDVERFSRELKDVDVPRLDVDGLLTFADFFFDSFLMDLAVQSRINEARRRVAEACCRLEDALRILNAAIV